MQFQVALPEFVIPPSIRSDGNFFIHGNFGVPQTTVNNIDWEYSRGVDRVLSAAKRIPDSITAEDLNSLKGLSFKTKLRATLNEDPTTPTLQAILEKLSEMQRGMATMGEQMQREMATMGEQMHREMATMQVELRTLRDQSVAIQAQIADCNNNINNLTTTVQLNEARRKNSFAVEGTAILTFPEANTGQPKPNSIFEANERPKAITKDFFQKYFMPMQIQDILRYYNLPTNGTSLEKRARLCRYLGL